MVAEPVSVGATLIKAFDFAIVELKAEIIEHECAAQDAAVRLANLEALRAFAVAGPDGGTEH